jgi:hypothetical protein
VAGSKVRHLVGASTSTEHSQSDPNAVGSLSRALRWADA